MSIGLFIGRFQPFHKGHLEIIKLALGQVDSLKIVLGTAQESRTEINPLTAAEREKIISATLADEGITNFSITALDDVDDNDSYAGYVKDNVGHFDTVFSGENKLVKELFTNAGHSVVDSERLNGWIATEIRRRVKEGEDFSDLVPAKVSEILDTNLLV